MQVGYILWTPTISLGLPIHLSTPRGLRNKAFFFTPVKSVQERLSSWRRKLNFPVANLGEESRSSFPRRIFYFFFTLVYPVVNSNFSLSNTCPLHLLPWEPLVENN